MKSLSGGLRTVLVCCSLTGSVGATAQPLGVTLATIPESIPAVKPDGSLSTTDRPGFRVEVLRSAGQKCGATVNFLPVPWQRAIELVKTGSVDGAFSASWSEERAGFGVFPLKNGVPDPAKAMKGYTYSLYVYPGSSMSWDGKVIGGTERKVIVERGSAGVGIAKKLGLEPVEASGYPNMVRMLIEKRAQGLVAVDTHVEKVLEENPKLTGAVKEMNPPLEAKHGYVMFGKPFYQKQGPLAECMWKALSDIRSKPSYRDLVKSYNNGEFIE